MIRKFKNGNIRMKADWIYVREDGSIHPNFYHNEMFMSDLTFNQINGYVYLVDFNKQLVYNVLEYFSLAEFLDYLKDGKVVKFYPLSKKECKSLLQDMENGY